MLAGGFLADWLWGGLTTTKETHDDDLEWQVISVVWCSVVCKSRRSVNRVSGSGYRVSDE